MIQTCIDSPVGVLTLAGPEDGVLSRLHFGEGGFGPDVPGAFAAAHAQLAEYFAGQRRVFDLTLAPVGTPFQCRVWSELTRIPYGETRTYGEVAVACSDGVTPRTGAGSARAVGSANNRNPLAIIVPCHRVVGADGTLVGFAGGLDTKRRLLDLEAGRLALI